MRNLAIDAITLGLRCSAAAAGGGRYVLVRAQLREPDQIKGCVLNILPPPFISMAPCLGVPPAASRLRGPYAACTQEIEH